MSPLRRHTPGSRDAALARRHRMVVTATVGGLTAVGVITGALAVSAAQSGAAGSSNGASSGVASDPAQNGGVSADPGSAPGLQPPANQPSFNRGGSGFGAVTGGSGHH